jgi:hypothetical protein
VVSTETKFWNRNILLKKLFFLIWFNLCVDLGCWSFIIIFEDHSRVVIWLLSQLHGFLSWSWLTWVATSTTQQLSSLFNHIISGSSRIFHAFVVGAWILKDTHVHFKGTHWMFFSPCLGVLTLFAKSQATQAIGKSYLESSTS